MVGIVITVKSDAALKRLRKFAAAMSPQSRMEVNRRAAVAMHSHVMRTFDAQGAYDGQPAWEPLKAGGRWIYERGQDGRRTRASFDPSAKILQDTGALRQAYSMLYDANATGVGALSGAVHADIAAQHEFGDPSRNLPARPMLPTPEAGLKIVTTLYGIHLEQAARS